MNCSPNHFPIACVASIMHTNRKMRYSKTANRISRLMTKLLAWQHSVN